MSDSEFVKKMLRAVLQSSKEGVPFARLNSDYRLLCGEAIPIKKLGFSKLEDFLRSIPSVVRLDYRMGELRCFAGACEETTHITELVARQKSSKKSGRSQLVNCKLRFKPSNPYTLNVRQSSCLRQPSTYSTSNWSANRSQFQVSFRGSSAAGDYRQFDQRFSSCTPVEHRPPPRQTPVSLSFLPDSSKENIKSSANTKAAGMPPAHVSKPIKPLSGLYDVALVQSRMSELLKKHNSGVWMSNLSNFYSEMFGQTLPTQALIDMEKWTHICMVENFKNTNKADQLIYPPLQPKPSTLPFNSTSSSPSVYTTSSATQTCPSPPSCSTLPRLCTLPFSPTVTNNRVSPKSPLAAPTFIFPPPPAAAASSGKESTPTTSQSTASKDALVPQLPLFFSPADQANCGWKDHKDMPRFTMKNKRNNQNSSSTQITCLNTTFPPPCTSPTGTDPQSLPVISADVRNKLQELLSKCSAGLWVEFLPKRFLDTYKMPLPEHVVKNLHLLVDICSVEYTSPHDKTKAIVYAIKADMENTGNQECGSNPLPSGLEVLGPVVPPKLVLPSEQYPSVLVTEAKSSCAVTIRYVGENYSNSQEAMEEMMHSFYSQSSKQNTVSNPKVGQLVAVKGEDPDEVARAQVTEVMGPNRFKIYYVDYGFSAETKGTNLLELHQDFASLPFQATVVRLADVEVFSNHPLVVSSLEKLAVGKILLMETLEPCKQNKTPVVVLYDTSQDDDININSACLKALQDNTMNNPLNVNTTYQNVCVTNVCADGIIHCQLQSRGNARLSKLLEAIEACFSSQRMAEFLVSRPFTGKFCLGRYKGKWARVEITNMYTHNVMEVVFVDMGAKATVEVADLREIPLLLLKDFVIIPPQAIKCRLADLTVPEGDWSPQAVFWIEEAVQGAEKCRMKILKVDQHKGDKLVHMHLFVGADGLERDSSINHQLAKSEIWQKLTALNNNTITCKDMERGDGPTSCSQVLKPAIKAETQPSQREVTTSKTGTSSLPLPPSLEFPQHGQNMDVYVPVACHPGHFVLQRWDDLHKLVVLMGEMMLYYNQMGKTNTVTSLQVGELYAAKVDKNWYRVQVKRILANGFVFVYELDHGKNELVRSTAIQPLLDEFRQLPFQAMTAQLAGMPQHQWSEEASMLFRSYVEQRALVAQLDSLQDASEVKGDPWERRLSVYLVDTSMEGKDLWIHTIMTDIDGSLS